MTGTAIQVMRLAARGFIAKEIGVELGLSERQVERHLFDVRHELGAKNTVEAVSKFIQSQRKRRGGKIPPYQQPSNAQLSFAGWQVSRSPTHSSWPFARSSPRPATGGSPSPSDSNGTPKLRLR